MAQYCEICGKVTNCTDDCKKCLEEETKKEETSIKYDKDEVWAAIHEISDIRGGYNLFDPKETPKYHACSLAIRALREVIGEPI